MCTSQVFMVKVQEVQERLHCFSRDVLDFDFSSGCFNHATAAIAQHALENFALIAQDDFVARKCFAITQDFDIAEVIFQKHFFGQSFAQ